MFIGRKDDGSIYGLWSVQQWDGQEELRDDHADVSAFRAGQEAKFDLSAKKSAAMQATMEKALADQIDDPMAPQAVKDYAEAIKDRP